MTQATVIKSGNSYALLVPNYYIDDNHLKPGDVITIEESLERQKQALEALVELGKKKGPIKAISDPVVWQRQQRHYNDLTGKK